MRLALIIAVALLSSCANPEGNRQWLPTPGAAIKVGLDVAPAVPLPADCPADLIASMYRVEAISPSTATIRDELLVMNVWTVPQHCVVPYVLR